jgi:hypothetical protein
VTRIPTSFLITWIVTALVAIAVWLVIPGSKIERNTFKALAQRMAGSPIEISGAGSHADPWQMSFRSNPGDGSNMPGTVALKDNLENIFQSSPHSPIDMAVIFKNLQRLGTKHLACSVLLAWEEPDPIALTALEGALLDFESVVLAAPVTRSAIMEAMPADFRRASIPLEKLSGDPSSLPVVNRVSIPSIIHGGENAMAGFEVIDSEPTAEHLHLMARWDDRVIFSFPVIATLRQLGLDPDDLKIEVGSHLQLGVAGPRIPIDEFGGIAIESLSVNPKTDLFAKELIDAEVGDSKLPDLKQAILCDLRSHADITTRDFNRLIPSCMEKLLQGQGKPEQLTIKRIGSSLELPLLLVLALALSFAGLLGRVKMSMICLLVLGGCSAATWLGLQNERWLPVLAALVIVATAWACSIIFTQGRKRTTTSMPRLDRLEFDALEEAKDPYEGQDYALAPKEVGLESKHESD